VLKDNAQLQKKNSQEIKEKRNQKCIPKFIAKKQMQEEHSTDDDKWTFHIKCRHDVKDRIYGCWVHDHEGKYWYPGTVFGYEVIKDHPTYGEQRTYDIQFDDGTADHHLGEEFVMSYTDYEISVDDNLMTGLLKKGLKICSDTKSSDRYAKFQGWYMTDKTGKTIFASLTNAVQALDKIVVEEKGSKIKPSDLNLPKDWNFDVNK